MRREKINNIFQNLSKSITNPKTELKYKNAFIPLLLPKITSIATELSIKY